MRLVPIAIALACATARADEPAAQPMQGMTDTATYCEGMRKAWSNDAATCARVLGRDVRGLGTIEAWQAATQGETHWMLMIRTAHGLWMSPEVSLPGDQCGAGHCHALEATPVLHVIHPHGRTAVALELRTTERWYLNEGGGKTYRGGSGSTFIVCGAIAGDELRCELLGGRNDTEACTARLDDAGKLAHTCAWTEQVELGAMIGRAAVLAVALLIPTAVRADDDWTALDVTPLPDGATPCHDRPKSCHRVATVRTKAGPVELYVAADARTTTGAPSRGEYLAMYVIALPGKLTAMFEEGARPNAHHYEICGAASDWCGRIVSSTPRLTVDRKGSVTVVVKTITLDQRWADPAHVARGTVRERHALIRTVTCVDTEDGWGCSASP